MPRHIIIDGNNLLYAMHEHAPMPHVGRETMVQVIDRWARSHDDKVTLVFDGPIPRGGLAQQMSSSRITVRFSGKETADDVIVRIVKNAKYPNELRVVSGDGAIRHEARYRKAESVDSAAFVAELFPSAPRGIAKPTPAASDEKPGAMSKKDVDAWLQAFDIDAGPPEEPFDGYDAMTGE